jgi:undecaprenyl-phosphate 4-deoxy-4-formamido-L-arabinose transferase
VKLWQHARREGLDVVYGHYVQKEHSAFRNFGSWLTNRMTDWVLDKPKGFYLSSFRCLNAFVAKEVAAHEGPFPYIDGLILQVTQNIGTLEVQHAERVAGQSGYTLRRLLRLWLSTIVNFSVMPLRLATLLGLIMAAAGLLGLGFLFYLRFVNQGPDYGWGSLMGALLVFSGTQLVVLGLIGEYVGRMFLTVNRRPQSVVRSVERAG